ncbi:MAG: hypothetical protein JWP25_4522 [Bradyrhizobium sp.]|jgi:hypothetical protein|nr:hypothetical protein [Bradyrhizobium sp.]MEA2866724.1 hypothetical protein [Bradyrhizobium sp.]
MRAYDGAAGRSDEDKLRVVEFLEPARAGYGPEFRPLPGNPNKPALAGEALSDIRIRCDPVSRL